MTLSKSDFILFLFCPQSFWLSQCDPDEVPRGEFSAFQQKLTREGYEVERYVQDLFNQNYVDSAVDFQRTFNTDSGLTARADVVEVDGDGRCNLFEVKSSTRVKREAKHDQLKDACFQLITAERSGLAINCVSIIHVNGDYVRDGEIDPEQLLVIVDVTDDVRVIQEETEREIDAALALLNEPDIDRSFCSCLRKTRSNHCDTFGYFNPTVPSPSIYSLPRIRQNKIVELVDQGIFELTALPDGFKLSNSQTPLVEATRSGSPVINSDAIRRFLDEIEFPLWFFDYETYMSAIPIIDGTGPHRHLPFQYSLHVLDEHGNLDHHEYLSPTAQPPAELLQHMLERLGPSGTVVSWHASFEKARNEEMVADFPDYAGFLTDMNRRTIDLEDLFKRDYVDAQFDGSSSIKKVLPVVCPHLSYDGMDVADGTAAMETWARMTDADTGEEERAKLESSLREYCALDTMAMVEIYRFLRTTT